MNHQEQVIPFLARFSTQRNQGEQLKGWYCPKSLMWMVDTERGPRPAIEHASATLEMTTKTFVERESDDDIALELMTKTDAHREQDD